MFVFKDNINAPLAHLSDNAQEIDNVSGEPTDRFCVDQIDFSVSAIPKQFLKLRTFLNLQSACDFGIDSDQTVLGGGFDHFLIIICLSLKAVLRLQAALADTAICRNPNFFHSASQCCDLLYYNCWIKEIQACTRKHKLVYLSWLCGTKKIPHAIVGTATIGCP